MTTAGTAPASATTPPIGTRADRVWTMIHRFREPMPIGTLRRQTAAPIDDALDELVERGLVTLVTSDDAAARPMVVVRPGAPAPGTRTGPRPEGNAQPSRSSQPAATPSPAPARSSHAAPARRGENAGLTGLSPGQLIGIGIAVFLGSALIQSMAGSSMFTSTYVPPSSPVLDVLVRLSFRLGWAASIAFVALGVLKSLGVDLRR